jgi:acetyl esterase/lipase
MTATPHFSGVERDSTHREQARSAALRLREANPSLGYHLLWSAASYLLRDGQQLRDSAVVAEARRRATQIDQAIAAVKRRAKERAARRTEDEDESPFAQIAEGQS